MTVGSLVILLLLLVHLSVVVAVVSCDLLDLPLQYVAVATDLLVS